MPAITIIDSSGNTAQFPAFGVSGSIYAIGQPQSITAPNGTASFPGKHIGLFILQTVIGVDGLPWYRWDSDIPFRADLLLPVAYNLTYAP